MFNMDDLNSGTPFNAVSSASRWVAGVCFLAVFGVLLLYLLHFYRGYFTSDDAVANLLAEEIWRQGTLLPQHWINNNGDLMMPSIATIVAPLLAWYPNGYGVHAVGSVCAAALMIGSLIYLLRVLGMPFIVIASLATLLASGLSFISTIMLFAQGTYTWWTAAFCLGAATIYRCRAREAEGGSSSGWISFGLFLLIFCVSITNPGRVGLMAVLPLYVLDLVVRLGRRLRTANGSVLARAVRVCGLDDRITALGLVGGFALAAFAYVVLRHLHVTDPSDSAAALRWGGIEGVWRHLSTFRGWFTYWGGDAEPHEIILPFSPLLIWFRWGIAVWITWIGFSEVVRWPHEKDVARRAMTAALLAAFAPVFLVYVLFEPLAQGTGTLRYFTLPIVIMIVLSGFRLRDALRRVPLALAPVLAAAGIVIAVSTAMRLLPVDRLGASEFWQVTNSTQQQLGATLQREGLHWGYATWWNAGATSVLADSRIEVHPVWLVPSGVKRFISMISRDWYQPEAWDGNSFLALTRAEASHEELDVLRSALGEPIRTIESKFHIILVYDHNISANFERD